MALNFSGVDPRYRKVDGRLIAIAEQPQPDVNFTASTPPPQVNSFSPSIASDMAAWQDYEPFRDYMVNRARLGVGFLPMEPPVVDYSESRDPSTGNYLSRSVDVSTIPELSRLAGRYETTINDRMSRDMATANAIRDRVRAAAVPTMIREPRLEQSLTWSIGPDGRVLTKNTYNPVYDEIYSPYLPLNAKYA